MVIIILLLSIFSFSIEQHGQESPAVVLHQEDAEVWHPEQAFSGELNGLQARKVLVHHNERIFTVEVGKEKKFQFQLVLKDLENRIWVEVPGSAIVSDTVNYTLGYEPEPIIKPSATIVDGKASLKAEVIENPYHLPLTYHWREAEGNPASSVIIDKRSATASVQIPRPVGDYYYEVAVVADEDSTWYRTKITREKDSLYYFDIDKSYPTWMDDAIIYQITPASFVEDGTFADITAKLEEIKELGINTIWLQPIFGTHSGGQGYDVTDYTGINPEFGNEQQLRDLITKAKELDLRVLFDVVLNHSSINHPYAKDRIENGKRSHYYDFYQHEDDGKEYSSFYNQDENGFINYFWDDLVNLNYNNKEVRRWILEAAKYWIREFDIDGYRLDAIWGLNARNPAFAKKLRTEIKSIKPEALMLAEDKGSRPEVYDLGFDAAYDWTIDTTWVSQWSWEHTYVPKESHTIFNFEKVEERDEMLEKALFDSGGNNHRKLYYIKNNDLPSFVKEHGLERTKMAAALLFSMPGIPMLYNGQETGYLKHPYADAAIFRRDRSIKSLDNQGLFDYYKELIQLHKKYPAIKGTRMSELPVKHGEGVTAFRRWTEDQNFVVVVNLSDEPVYAVVDLSPLNVREELVLPGAVMNDVLSKEAIEVKSNVTEVKVPMPAHSTRWLLIPEISD